MRSPIVASVLAAVLSHPSAATAAEHLSQEQRTFQQPTPEQQDDETKRKLEEQIAKELGQEGQKSPAAQPRGQPVPGAQAPTGGNPAARLLLLPDISAVGSFAAAYDSYDVETLSPREGPFGPKNKPQRAVRGGRARVPVSHRPVRPRGHLRGDHARRGGGR